MTIIILSMPIYLTMRTRFPLLMSMYSGAIVSSSFVHVPVVHTNEFSIRHVGFGFRSGLEMTLGDPGSIASKTFQPRLALSKDLMRVADQLAHFSTSFSETTCVLLMGRCFRRELAYPSCADSASWPPR